MDEDAAGDPSDNRKRRPKRKLVPKPEPSEPGQIVSERISVVKQSLAGIVRRRDFLALLENVVVVANQMTKRISMLAKLMAGETLPRLDQGFYSALYTSLRSGKWNHGHDALLARRLVGDPGLGSVMSQVMALVGKKLASELDTHYRRHYERFYGRWKRVCLGTVDGEEKDAVFDGHFLDPDETQLESLVREAWAMRRDLEVREARGFTLFPETSAKVSYVTLDATCIAHLYRRLHPEAYRVPGKRPGTTRAKPINDVTADHGSEIFSELFDLPKVLRLRRSHHFRYSLQTDGVGVALSFGRWAHSTPRPRAKPSRETTKRCKTAGSNGAATKRVADLRPGFAYGAQNKTLASLAELKGVTVRCVDPGVRRTYTSVDLLTGDEDVRTSVKMMRSRTWQSRTRAKEHGAKMKVWHDRELGQVQKKQNSTPFRTSAEPSR